MGSHVSHQVSADSKDNDYADDARNTAVAMQIEEVEEAEW